MSDDKIKLMIGSIQTPSINQYSINASGGMNCTQICMEWKIPN